MNIRLFLSPTLTTPPTHPLGSAPSIESMTPSATGPTSSAVSIVVARPLYYTTAVQYTVTLNNDRGSVTCPSSGSPTTSERTTCSVPGLLSGAAYTVAVYATDGTGLSSVDVAGSFFSTARWVSASGTKDDGQAVARRLCGPARDSRHCSCPLRADVPTCPAACPPSPAPQPPAPPRPRWCLAVPPQRAGQSSTPSPWKARGPL